MKQFRDFGIKSIPPNFTGDKITMKRVINKEIEVHNFKIEPSNFKGQCLYLQIKIDGEMRIIFTGSTGLIDMIQKVPKENFPFKTTIVEEDERFIFT